MYRRTKCLLVALLCTVAGANVYAQTSTVSNPNNGRDNNPYSKYGVGELLNSNNAALKGMGSITSAYESGYFVNSDNPASYSFLKRTTFDVGMIARSRHMVTETQSYNSSTATVSYINIGLPINNKAGLTFGFKPYSHVFYNLRDTLTPNTIPPSPIDTIIRLYNGAGDLNHAYIGFAGKIKGFSLGVNVGYLFGNIRHSAKSVPYSSLAVNNAYEAEFSNYLRIGGLYGKAGVMYKYFDSASNFIFRAGGTIAINQRVNENLESYHISIFNFGDTIARDTVYNPGVQAGKLTMPMSYSGGITIGKADKWTVGIDYTSTQWSEFASTPDNSLTSGVGPRAYKIAIGGEFIPNINALRSYSSKITYRAGAYYGTDYLKLNNTVLPVYGVTAGASFPIRRSFSQVHTAFDIGRMGTTDNNLIRQTYVRFSLGISFNDLWFVKRRLQ